MDYLVMAKSLITVGLMFLTALAVFTMVRDWRPDKTPKKHIHFEPSRPWPRK
jgi:hypothetical protein